MNTHPECKPDEIYMGNTTLEDFPRSCWLTKRIGKQPLLANGEPYNGSDLVPWFIERSEIERTIEAERLANKPWSAERIGVFQKMLTDGVVLLEPRVTALGLRM